MKVTIELENDSEKALAKRFLGSDSSPVTLEPANLSAAMRVMLALRTLNHGSLNAEEIKAKREERAKRQAEKVAVKRGAQ